MKHLFSNRQKGRNYSDTKHNPKPCLGTYFKPVKARETKWKTTPWGAINKQCLQVNAGMMPGCECMRGNRKEEQQGSCSPTARLVMAAKWADRWAAAELTKPQVVWPRLCSVNFTEILKQRPSHSLYMPGKAFSKELFFLLASALFSSLCCAETGKKIRQTTLLRMGSLMIHFTIISTIHNLGRINTHIVSNIHCGY